MIKIIKQIDELSYVEWRFTFIDNTLFLDDYIIWRRQTIKSKKYSTDEQYCRLMTRGNNINEKDVPLTKEIKEEALNLFISKIKVCRWSERQ